MDKLKDLIRAHLDLLQKDDLWIIYLLIRKLIRKKGAVQDGPDTERSEAVHTRRLHRRR
jgi:hypothetical protein